MIFPRVNITTAQFHSTKPKLKFCAGLNPASDVSEVCDGESFRTMAQVRSKFLSHSLISHSPKIIHLHPIPLHAFKTHIFVRENQMKTI